MSEAAGAPTGVFEALGDPVRRLVLETLAAGEQPAGALVAVVRERFGISQPGASQHLRVLRDSGLVEVRADGARRWYAVREEGLAEVSAWLERFRGVWDQPLDALATELARGRRERRRAATPAPSQPAPNQPAPNQPAPNQPAPNRPAPNRPAPIRPAPGEAARRPAATEAG